MTPSRTPSAISASELPSGHLPGAMATALTRQILGYSPAPAPGAAARLGRAPAPCPSPYPDQGVDHAAPSPLLVSVGSKLPW
jgi:hypothetical protein